MAQNLNSNLSQNILFKQIPLSNYNFANNTKWIFNIPIAHLLYKNRGTNVDDTILQCPLNCQRIQFPTFTIGTTSSNYLGHTVNFSSRQNTTEKGLTVTFLVSNNWLQYLLLMKWFNLNDYTNYDNDSNTDRSYDSSSPESQNNPYASAYGPQFPSHLYLLDNFNHRIATFHFWNSWLCKLSTIPLDYTNTDNTQVTTDFELKYFKMDMEINDEFLKPLITPID